MYENVDKARLAQILDVDVKFLEELEAKGAIASTDGIYDVPATIRDIVRYLRNMAGAQWRVEPPFEE